jgi:hypothetical protein
MSNFRVVSRGIKKIVTNHYHDSWPMAMCPQQIYSARSLSRIFQEDLEVFLELAKEGANQSPANPISYVFFVA